MNISTKKIIVVVPVYNEQEIIENVIFDLKNYLSDTNYKIIILNDGSNDNTEEKLKIFENNEKILVINKQNEGHGKTLIRGYEIALKMDFDYVIQIDSDDQIPIIELQKIGEFIKNYDLVCGYRFKRKDPFVRILITNILKFLIFFRHGVLIKDPNIPFRIMKKVFLQTAIDKIKNSHIPNVLLSILASKTKNLKQIKTIHKPRNTGVVSIKRFKLLVFCMRSFLEVLKFKKN